MDYDKYNLLITRFLKEGTAAQFLDPKNAAAATAHAIIKRDPKSRSKALVNYGDIGLLAPPDSLNLDKNLIWYGDAWTPMSFMGEKQQLKKFLPTARSIQNGAANKNTIDDYDRLKYVLENNLSSTSQKINGSTIASGKNIRDPKEKLSYLEMIIPGMTTAQNYAGGIYPDEKSVNWEFYPEERDQIINGMHSAYGDNAIPYHRNATGNRNDYKLKMDALLKLTKKLGI